MSSLFLPGRKTNALARQFVNVEKVSLLCGQSHVCFVIYLYVTLVCDTFHLMDISQFCESQRVADIRGGNRRNNSLVRLDHLFI